MRIGVNALYLIPGGVGGTEIYLRELLLGLAAIDSSNDYYVFTNSETSEDLIPQQPNFHWEPQSVHASFRPARILWEQTVLPLRARARSLDVLFNPGFTAPVIHACPNVTVFHDLQHIRHPEFFRTVDRPFWRLALWLSVLSSAHIIAVSRSTAGDLQQHYGRSLRTVTVVPHGVDPHFFQLDRTILEPYVLCVSTLHPHKNIERLMRAFARADLKKRLVCAGMLGFHAQRLHEVRTDLGLGGSVEFTGWIPRHQLLQLYERAHAVVYPSTFEGFGMPVLEGMAAGIPTACSSIPVLREVGGDAVLYFDPHDEDAIVKSLRSICHDEQLRTRLARAGRSRAQQYTWQRTAGETLRVLQAVAGEARSSAPR
jgi:glycosyltransferase involved in cell wall biosynthesis